MQSKLVRWQRVRIGSSGRKFLHDGVIGENTWLYHTLQWRHAKKIYYDKRLRFSPVKNWSDPNNPLSDCQEIESCEVLFNRETSLKGVTAYGMCLSINRSERWWLKPRNDIEYCRVRLRTTMEAIRKVGYELIKKSDGSLFAGSVRYHEEEMLNNIRESVASGTFKEVSRTAAGVLMYKSPKSIWQEEIRLLWFDRNPESDDFYITVDPSIMIDEIEVSPYEPTEVRRTVQNEIAELTVGTSRK